MLSNTGMALRGATGMLRDRCTIGTYTAGASNDYNFSSATWDYGNEIKCSYQDGSADEAPSSVLDVPKADATLWMLRGTAITPEFRIKLTKRNGIPLDSPLVFQVMGEPTQDVLLLKIKLKMVVEKSS